MRTVLQRVKKASVTVNGELTGKIGRGLAIFIGIQVNDTLNDVRWMVEKVVNLRIFEDRNGKMNRSLTDIGGEMLIVSQFTLYGDCRKGRRPGFSTAAPPEKAEPLYLEFIKQVRDKQIAVAAGIFQAEMEVEIRNQGPVTLLLDSEKQF